MSHTKVSATDTLRALRAAFVRHQALMPTLLDADESAIDHFSWSEDAFRGLFYGIASATLGHGDSLPCPPVPGTVEHEIKNHRYWQPIRQIARERPEWIIDLLTTPGVRSRFPGAARQLLECLQLTADRQLRPVNEFLRRLLYRRSLASAAWREQAVALLAHHHPVDLREILAHVRTHDPAAPVRAAAARRLQGLANEPRPVVADAREALLQHLGAPENWLEPGFAVGYR